MNTEVSNSESTGEPTIASAARGPSPTLVMRRSDDEGRPEVPVMVLRSHSRGGRSSACAQEPFSQAGSQPIETVKIGVIPLDRESPDRKRKHTTTALVPLSVLSRWVLVSILRRQRITPPKPALGKLTPVPTRFTMARANSALMAPADFTLVLTPGTIQSVVLILLPARLKPEIQLMVRQLVNQ